MGFPRQEHWSGLPFPSTGDPSYPGMEPLSPAMTGRFFTTVPPGKLKTLDICLMDNNKIRMNNIPTLT